MRLAIWIVSVLIFVGYTLMGTEGNVKEIKDRAPSLIEARGWDIKGYEGYRRGSWGSHGGKVWYHVIDREDRSIRYRVYITLWNDELHFVYGQPEQLQRVNINLEELEDE